MREHATDSSGWRQVPLGELCAILSGGTPPKSEPRYWTGDIPWVSGKDMKAPLLRDTIDHVSHEALGAGTRLAPAGSVLLLVRGMGLAKDLPVAVTGRDMAFNQDIKALVPHDLRLGPFIRAAIYHKRNELLSRIVPSAHGTMTLNLDDVERFEISMPGEVDEALAIAVLLQTVRDKRELTVAEQQLAHELKEASARHLLAHGPLGALQRDSEIGRVPHHWDVVPLASLGRVGNGSTPKRNTPAYWENGDTPWLNSGKVYERDIVDSDQFVTATALAECHLPVLSPGAVLIAITGQGKTLGHCAVLRTRATVSQHLAYVAADVDRVDPSFLRAYLETQYDYFRQVGAGGGSTKGALTCAFLRGVAVPLPPLNEQRDIAAILDAIDRKIDLHRRKRAVLDDLFKALLHKLMTGELRVADLDLSALAPAESVA